MWAWADQKTALTDNYESNGGRHAIKELQRSWPRTFTSLCAPLEYLVETI